MGDTGGNVNAFHFTSSNIALFDRPQQPGGEGQGKKETLCAMLWQGGSLQYPHHNSMTDYKQFHL